MKRGDLAAHVRRRIDELVGDLTERVVGRVEQQITEMLETAVSALESDLAHRDVKPSNLIARNLGPDLDRALSPRKQRRGRTVSSDDVSSRRAEPGEDSAKRSTHSPGPNRAAGTSDALSRRPKSCSKCRAVGFTSAGCGRTHNVSPTPAEDDSEVQGPASPRSYPRASSEPDRDDDDDSDDESEKTESPPHVARKRDRFAEIEASARKRAGTLPVPRSTTVL